MVNYSNLKQSKSSTTVTSEGKLLHKIDTTVLLGSLDDPEKVAECFRLIWNTSMITEQEEIYAIYVDAELKIIEYRNLFRGGLSSVTLDNRVAIRYALLNKASAVFLAHNHPSGSFTPSDLDKQTTAKFIQAASAFDIRLLDHIIITSDSYCSFVEEGIINEYNAGNCN
jgi:DNA repair protein RadC